MKNSAQSLVEVGISSFWVKPKLNACQTQRLNLWAVCALPNQLSGQRLHTARRISVIGSFQSDTPPQKRRTCTASPPTHPPNNLPTLPNSSHSIITPPLPASEKGGPKCCQLFKSHGPSFKILFPRRPCKLPTNSYHWLNEG